MLYMYIRENASLMMIIYHLIFYEKNDLYKKTIKNLFYGNLLFINGYGINGFLYLLVSPGGDRIG